LEENFDVWLPLCNLVGAFLAKRAVVQRTLGNTFFFGGCLVCYILFLKNRKKVFDGELFQRDFSGIKFFFKDCVMQLSDTLALP
jgi:hypothetical protein